MPLRAVYLGTDPTAIDEAGQSVEVGKKYHGMHQLRQRPVVISTSQFLEIIMSNVNSIQPSKEQLPLPQIAYWFGLVL